MARALELARAVEGLTSPNPPVGAVLVRDGAVVGEGSTQPPGGPHAEIVALQVAGERARGATLYVTLEPCSHWGRTPPCADALLKAGIAAAHAALLDPNPAVRGAGAARLAGGGVAVTLGEGAAEATDLIRPHRRYILTGTPFVTLQLSPSPEVLTELVRTADAVVRAAGPVDPALVRALRAAGRISRSQVVRVSGTALVVDDLRPVPPAAVPRAPLPQHVWDWPALLAELGRREITSVLVPAPHAVHPPLPLQLVDRIAAATPNDLPDGFDAAGALRGMTDGAVAYRAGEPG